MESARGECGEKIFPFSTCPHPFPPFAVVLSDSKHLPFLGSEQSIQQEQRSQHSTERSESDTFYAVLCERRGKAFHSSALFYDK